MGELADTERVFDQLLEYLQSNRASEVPALCQRIVNHKYSVQTHFERISSYHNIGLLFQKIHQFPIEECIKSMAYTCPDVEEALFQNLPGKLLQPRQKTPVLALPISRAQCRIDPGTSAALLDLPFRSISSPMLLGLSQGLWRMHYVVLYDKLHRAWGLAVLDDDDTALRTDSAIVLPSKLLVQTTEHLQMPPFFWKCHGETLEREVLLLDWNFSMPGEEANTRVFQELKQ